MLLKLTTNNNAEADTAVVSKVIAVFITIFVAILLVYTIAGSMNAHDTDKDLWGPTWNNGSGGLAYNTTPMQNATNNSIEQSATFFTIAPIIAIVMVAVVILRYVGMI